MSKNRIEFGPFTFEDGYISSGSLRVTQNPLGTTLEIDTMKAEVICTDKAILNFRLNTPIKVYHKEELLGIFYAQEVYRLGPIQYRISGINAIGLLENITHYGGMYTGETTAEVLKGLFGSIPYYVKSSVGKVKLYNHLPIATARENLSQILIASGAVVRIDRDGAIRVEDLYDYQSNTLPPNKVFIESTIRYNSPVTRVIVTEHQYIKDPASEEKVLFEGTVQQGDIITFRSPAYDIVAEGVTILDQNANFAKVSGGSAVIKGKEYTHIEREVSRDVQPSQVESIKRISDATLVSLVNSEAVAARLAAYYKQSEVLELDFVRQRQGASEIVSTYDPYEYQPTKGFTEAVEISLGGHLFGEAEILTGYTPSRVEDIDLRSERVVLTGSGEWIPPEGVTEVTAVLIDGGAEGLAGQDGEGSSTSIGSSDSQTRTVTLPANQWTLVASASASSRGSGSNGSGGKAGTGGSGGRVYRITMAVTPGSPISYACGGPVLNGESSTTTFGTASSENGSRSDSGYTDPITGELYAKPGDDGLDGGDGGSGGNPGQSSGIAVGGEGFKGGSTSLGTSDTSVRASFNVSGAGGGGAGGGGSSGEDAFLSQRPDTSGNTALCSASSGGNGGNGKDGSNGATYGSGGEGGGGGGGAGSCGDTSVQCSVYDKLYALDPEATSESTKTATARALSSYTPKGGKGGKAGKGKEGCIIIYYGIRLKQNYGAFCTADGRLLCDAVNRKFIV